MNFINSFFRSSYPTTLEKTHLLQAVFDSDIYYWQEKQKLVKKLNHSYPMNLDMKPLFLAREK